MDRVYELAGCMRSLNRSWKRARTPALLLAGAAFMATAATVLVGRYARDATAQSVGPAPDGREGGALGTPTSASSMSAELVPCGPDEACSTTASTCTSFAAGAGAAVCAEATPLETGGCASFALEGTTQHWFKFTVPGGGPWRYNFSTLGSGDTSCRVYSACGEGPAAGYSENLAPNDFNCRAAAFGGFEGEAGATYYVRVTGAGLYQPNLSISGPGDGERSAPAAVRDSVLRVLASAVASRDRPR